MSEANTTSKGQPEYYRVGDNIHGAFSHPFSTLEAARKQREKYVLQAIKSFAESSLSQEEARLHAEDWYWVCDDNEEIID